MRWLALALGVLIVALQYPMWLGKGGWLQVREYDRQLNAQREANAVLKSRNDALDADVRDLKTGFEAIEERARAELGMIRQDDLDNARTVRADRHASGRYQGAGGRRRTALASFVDRRMLPAARRRAGSGQCRDDDPHGGRRGL
jgi:cell division protein FtsB